MHVPSGHYSAPSSSSMQAMSGPSQEPAASRDRKGHLPDGRGVTVSTATAQVEAARRAKRHHQDVEPTLTEACHEPDRKSRSGGDDAGAQRLREIVTAAFVLAEIDLGVSASLSHKAEAAARRIHGSELDDGQRESAGRALVRKLGVNAGCEEVQRALFSAMVDAVAVPFALPGVGVPGSTPSQDMRERVARLVRGIARELVTDTADLPATIGRFMACGLLWTRNMDAITDPYATLEEVIRVGIAAAGTSTPRPVLLASATSAMIDLLANPGVRLQFLKEAADLSDITRRLLTTGTGDPATRPTLRAAVLEVLCGAGSRAAPDELAFMVAGLGPVPGPQAQADLSTILSAPGRPPAMRGAMAWGLALGQGAGGHAILGMHDTRIFLSGIDAQYAPLAQALAGMAAAGGVGRRLALAHALLDTRQASEMALRDEWNEQRRMSLHMDRPFDPSRTALRRLDAALAGVVAAAIGDCSRRQRFELVLHYVRATHLRGGLGEQDDEPHIQRLLPAPATDAALRADIAAALQLDPLDPVQVSQLAGFSTADRVGLMDTGGVAWQVGSAWELDAHITALAADGVDASLRAALLARLFEVNPAWVGTKQMGAARRALVNDILRAGDAAAAAVDVPQDDGQPTRAAPYQQALDRRESLRSQALLQASHELVDLYRGWRRGAALDETLEDSTPPAQSLAVRSRMHGRRDVLDAERRDLAAQPALWSIVQGSIGHLLETMRAQLDARLSPRPSASSSTSASSLAHAKPHRS